MSGTNGSLYIDDTGHDYHSDTGYRLTLTATDARGVSNTTAVEIEPEKVNLTLDADPGGAPVLLDGVQYDAPLDYDTLIGFRHTVSTPATRCVDGTSYEQAHVISPERTHHDDDHLEIIAPDELRETLGLADGTEVTVSVAQQ